MRNSGFIARLGTILLFIALETVSLLMIGRSGVVQRYKIAGAFRNAQYSLWKTGTSIGHYFGYSRENALLAEENCRLREELDAYKAAERDVPQTISAGDYTYIAATVLKNSVNRQDNFLILNRGERDGIRTGMGVITSGGVVGIVSAVDESRCRVVSFLSSGQSVSAKVSGSDAFGTLSWLGRSPSKALLTEIPAHIPVAEGDTVTTSGYSMIFPQGIPLGEVTSVSSDGISTQARVRLFQQFNALQHVYIVRINAEDEIRRLENG